MAADSQPPSRKRMPYAGWKCLFCQYDLTGAGEPRCPECGEPFSPEVMARVQDNESIPSTPWDERGRLFETLRQVTFTPRRFAKRLSVAPSAPESTNYGLALALVTTLFSIAVGAAGELLGLAADSEAFRAFYFLPFIAFAGVIAMIFVHEFIAVLMRLRFDPLNRSFVQKNVLTVLNYNAGFFILLTSWITSWLAVQREMGQSQEIAMIAGGAVIACWWFGNVLVMLCHTPMLQRFGTTIVLYALIGGPLIGAVIGYFLVR